MKTDERKAAVVSSALWAAAGDALGWMTELADQKTVSYRTGTEQVRTTVDWRRRIGGRFGPTVNLPAGTYSDDTQLRLAVSRAIRGLVNLTSRHLPKSNYLYGCRIHLARAAVPLLQQVTWPNKASRGSRISSHRRIRAATSVLAGTAPLCEFNRTFGRAGVYGLMISFLRC